MTTSVTLQPSEVVIGCSEFDIGSALSVCVGNTAQNGKDLKPFSETHLGKGTVILFFGVVFGGALKYVGKPIAGAVGGRFSSFGSRAFSKLPARTQAFLSNLANKSKSVLNYEIKFSKVQRYFRLRSLNE